MKNYIHKIAKDNIKKNKGFYRYVFISVFFTFFVVLLTNILSSSIDKTLYEKRVISHGRWDVIISNANHDIKQVLDDISYEKLGHLYYGGEVVYHNSTLGCIGSYDDVGVELANIVLSEGTMPSNSKEIIVEKSMANFLNTKVGETLSLDVSYNNQIRQDEYKVVGIVEDYSSGWSSRALSFITYSLDYDEYDLMLKADHAILLWNDLYWKVMKINNEHIHSEMRPYNIDIYNKNIYPDYQEVIYKFPGSAAFTNESDFLIQSAEIIVISFISLFSSMMTSLSKRESQFVLLRSMGMTYNQLKKMIKYEGYLLAFKALTFSVISSIGLSLGIMYLYSLISQNTFYWCINAPSLFIQLTVSCVIVYIGLVFPALTIYDLPLTRKNGEFVYHPKKRMIRKPTFSYFVKNEILNNKTWSIFIMIFISIMMIRGINIIDSTIEYLAQKEIAYKSDREIDFIWHVNEWQNSTYNYYHFDLSELSNQEDIHIYRTLIAQDKTMKWDNMENEDERIVNIRNMMDEVRGNLICIEYDQVLKDYLVKMGYHEFLNLKEDEAVVFIPNLNYNEPRTSTSTSDIRIHHHYTNNTKKKKSGLYAKDEGLCVGKSIHLTNKALKIKEVITLEDEMIRDYFNEYTVIVNEDTLKNYLKQYYGDYYVFDVDNIDARNKVMNFFVNHNIYGNETIFHNTYLEDLKLLYSNENQYICQVIYNAVLVFIYMSLIYMIRLLSTHKMRKNIGLLRNIGMTKRKIYQLHIIYSSLVYLLSIVIIIFFWLLLSQIPFQDYSIASFIHEYHLVMKCICTLCMFIIYMIFMLLPIKNILDETPLNLLR